MGRENSSQLCVSDPHTRAKLRVWAEFLRLGRAGYPLPPPGHALVPGTPGALPSLNPPELSLLPPTATEARERRQEQEATAARRVQATEEELHARRKALERRYAAAPHYTDEDFLRLYAAKHREELLQQREVIIQEFIAFLSDEGFIAYLQVHAPHLIEWHAAKAKALALAERHDGAPGKSAPHAEPKPERPKLTPEEFTERKVKWFLTKLREDESILKAGRAWLDQQEEEILAGIEDEDEREATRQHLESILGQALQTLNQNRKKGE